MLPQNARLVDLICGRFSGGDQQRNLLRWIRRFPGFILKGDRVNGVLARGGANHDSLHALSRSEKEVVHAFRTRQCVTIRSEHIQRQAIDAQLHEERGTDVSDAPELNLPRSNWDDRIELTVDCDDLLLGNLSMLYQQKPLGQIRNERKVAFESLYNESAGQSSQDLFCHDAVYMRVIPKQAGPLPVVRGNMNLVRELTPWMHVHEHIVAVAAG